jgi:hypothetical protein
VTDDLATCPACGFVALGRGIGSDAVCPVCGWTDDFQQRVHPDITYGANSGLSLRQAQQRLLISHPAGEGRTLGFERDPQWRPLEAGEVPLADEMGPSSPVCYIATPDAGQYIPYWLQRRRIRPAPEE